jgi:hypothetical protein
LRACATFASGVYGTVRGYSPHADPPDPCHDTAAGAANNIGSARMLAKDAKGAVVGSADVRDGLFVLALPRGVYDICYDYGGPTCAPVDLGAKPIARVDVTVSTGATYAIAR